MRIKVSKTIRLLVVQIGDEGVFLVAKLVSGIWRGDCLFGGKQKRSWDLTRVQPGFFAGLLCYLCGFS